jgi:hypothetical protein
MMAKSNGRRSSDDPKWVECKKLVDKRDKRNCQFDRCISAKEFHQLDKKGPVTLDRAHILSASANPEQIYNIKNIITLRRFIHTRMDDYQCPLIGESIELNKHWYWWWRIYNKLICDYDENIDYEMLLKSVIK